MVLHDVLPRRSYEIDEAILTRIEAREARRDVHGDIATLMDQHTGTYGIVEPVTPGDRDGAEAVALRAATAYTEAYQTDPNNPGAAAYRAMAALNDEAGRLGRQYRSTFLFFVPRPDGSLPFVSASTGGGQGYLFPQEKSGKDVLPATSDQDPMGVFDGSPAALDRIAFKTGTVETGDRLALVSSATEAHNATNEKAATQWLRKVGKRSNIRWAAGALVGRGTADRDKVGIVLDVLDDGEIGVVRGATPKAVSGMVMAGAGVREPHSATVADEENERPSRLQRIRQLGAAGVAGALLGRMRRRGNGGRHAAPGQPGLSSRLVDAPRRRWGSTWEDYKTESQAYYDQRTDRKGWRRPGVYAGAIPFSMLGTYKRRRQYRIDDMQNDPRYANMSAEERMVVIKRQDRRRGIAKVVAAGALVAAYPLLFDPGEDRGPSFLGLYHKNNDEGIDALGYPLDALIGADGSDRFDGNGWGYDLAPDNRTSIANDDPTIGHVDKSNDSVLPDIIPEWVPFIGGDGDSLSFPKGWPEWLGGGKPTEVWDPGSTGLGPGGRPLPDPTAPPVAPPAAPQPPVVPPVDVPEPPELPRAETWQPPDTTVNPGEGVEHLIHPWGHDEFGFNNFDGAKTHWVAEQMQAAKGEDWLQFADGSDATYIMPDGNIGLRGSGEIRITDEEIRRFFYELMAEAAKR